MPGTGTDPGDWGSVLRGLRRSRRLTLGEVADVLDVGPEMLALLEAGEWASGLGAAQRAALLTEYAGVLGLDESVVRAWLGDLDTFAEPRRAADVVSAATGPAGVASSAARSGAALSTGVRTPGPDSGGVLAGGNGRPQLSGAARFARLAPPPDPPSRPLRPGSGKKAPPRTLREARMRRGLTQEEAAGLLDMRIDLVAAMERGALDRLPRGRERSMLTRYADLLGLDSDSAPAALPAFQSPAWPDPPRSRHRVALWIRFSGGVFIVAGLVLAAIGVS